MIVWEGDRWACGSGEFNSQYGMFVPAGGGAESLAQRSHRDHCVLNPFRPTRLTSHRVSAAGFDYVHTLEGDLADGGAMPPAAGWRVGPGGGAGPPPTVQNIEVRASHVADGCCLLETGTNRVRFCVLCQKLSPSRVHQYMQWQHPTHSVRPVREADRSWTGPCGIGHGLCLRRGWTRGLSPRPEGSWEDCSSSWHRYLGESAFRGGACGGPHLSLSNNLSRSVRIVLLTLTALGCGGQELTKRNEHQFSAGK
jgi:hypothetical protein